MDLPIFQDDTEPSFRLSNVAPQSHSSIFLGLHAGGIAYHQPNPFFSYFRVVGPCPIIVRGCFEGIMVHFKADCLAMAFPKLSAIRSASSQ